MSYDTFAEAVLKKLITEVSSLEEADGDRTGQGPPEQDGPEERGENAYPD
jgi:hypothetical protein